MNGRPALGFAFAMIAMGCLAGPRHTPRTNHVGGLKAVAPQPTVALTPTPQPSAVEADTAAAAWPPTSASAAPSTPPPVIEDPPLVFANGNAPALTYAALSDAQCELQLKKRAIPYVKAEASNGVDFGIRFTGKLHGVDVHGQEPKEKRPKSPWEIVDCRLALSLDDFTKILASHDVVEAIHMSMYRPPAKNAKPPPAGTKRSRHEAALAIDLGTLVKKDGTKLVVLDHWHGYIGAKTCGTGAGPNPATKEALEIRAILCEAADAHLFNVVLTPNFNKPHANHFHLEVTRGVKWFIVH